MISTDNIRDELDEVYLHMYYKRVNPIFAHICPPGLHIYLGYVIISY